MAQCLRYRVAGQPAVREACGFHSLTVRLGSEATFDVVRERARAAADAHPATAGLSIWHERPPAARDDPTARARVQTEAGRPLHGAARPLRAVFLEYTQGPADLVLVARRSELSG